MINLTKEQEKKYEAIDRFLNERAIKENPDVVCPFCKTPLIYEEIGTSFVVRCHTPNCLKEAYRGI